jgi:excisionase family DNA binding protein
MVRKRSPVATPKPTSPQTPTPKPTSPQTPTPWRKADEASCRIRVSPKTLYNEVRSGRLRAARIAGRRSLRFLDEWLDEYLIAYSTPVEIPRRRA